MKKLGLECFGQTEKTLRPEVLGGTISSRNEVKEYTWRRERDSNPRGPLGPQALELVSRLGLTVS